jgi:hypothetical protein
MVGSFQDSFSPTDSCGAPDALAIIWYLQLRISSTNSVFATAIEVKNFLNAADFSLAHFTFDGMGITISL